MTLWIEEVSVRHMYAFVSLQNDYYVLYTNQKLGGNYIRIHKETGSDKDKFFHSR